VTDGQTVRQNLS